MEGQHKDTEEPKKTAQAASGDNKETADADGKKSGKAGKGGKQNKGDKSSSGGKGEKQGKSGTGGKNAKGDQSTGWVKKADGEKGQGDDEHAKGREKGNNRTQNRDNKRDNRQDSKKDGYKGRGKGTDGKAPAEAQGGASAAAGGTQAASGGSLSGGALLGMLKANPPSCRRYTKEELLSIGQLAASKVRPAGLDSFIDTENVNSPLLVRARNEKAPRKRGGDGEEDDAIEDDGAPRPAQQGHGGIEQQGGDLDGRSLGRKGGASPTDTWKNDSSLNYKGGGGNDRRYQEYSERKSSDPWDMPAPSDPGDLSAFTLGDIRQAEKAMNKGVSMNEYKDSYLQQKNESQKNTETFGSGADGNWDAAPGFFVDEDEEDTGGRFGKFFKKSGDGQPQSKGESSAPGAAASGSGPSSAEQKLQPGVGSSKPQRMDADADPAGKSILSMLGREEAASSPQPGKNVSVADLFDSARGKELPMVPPGADGKVTGLDGALTDGAEARVQREVLRMASQFMWAAAAKAGQAPVPPNAGLQMPGYAQGAGQGMPGMPGYGMAGNRGAANPQALQEAYAQAMMGMGRGGGAGGYGGNFGMNGPGGRGGPRGQAQAQGWGGPPQHPGVYGAPANPAMPYGFPGYPPQQAGRNPYAGGYDASSGNTFGAASHQSPLLGAQQAPPHRGAARGQAQPQGQASAGQAFDGRKMGGAAGAEQGPQDEEDAGCSQS